MSHPHNSPILYSGPGLIEADDFGGTHANLAAFAATLAARFDDSQVAGTATFSSTYQLNGHDVLRVGAHSYFEINGDGFTRTWMRAMVRVSNDWGASGDAQHAIGAEMWGDNLQGDVSWLVDTNSSDWVDQDTTVIADAAAAIVALKAGWCSVVVMSDLTELGGTPTGKLWLNGVEILSGTALYGPVGSLGGFRAEFGCLEPLFSEGYLYAGLFEMVEGENPYGLLVDAPVGESPRQFMKWPQSISETEVNFAEGRSTIGGMTVSILDKRLDPADQSTGIVTSIIEKLRDARCLVEYFYNGEWQVVMDGAVQNFTLDPKLVTYNFNLRDVREREREHRLFVENRTWAVYPERGSADGYGYPAGEGDPLLPPAAIMTGEYTEVADLTYRRQGYVEASASYFEQLDDELRAMGEPSTDTNGYGPVAKYPQLAVRWRPEGGGDDDWTYLRDATMPAILGAGNFFVAGEAGILNPGSLGIPVGFVPRSSLVRVLLEGPDEDMPADGASIEVQVLARQVTETTPFVWEGPFGTLLRQIYDGDFSDTPPRIGYDDARMAELEATTPDARLWLTEPVDDMRTWVEGHIYKVLGMAPVVNERGKIYPIAYELPASGTELPLLDDDNVAADAEWEAGLEGAISEVEFIYTREFRVPVTTSREIIQKKKGLFGIDFLSKDRTVTVEDVSYQVQQRTVRQVFVAPTRTKGEKLTYEPATVRVLGTIAGQPISGDSINETGGQIAAARAHQALHRFPFIVPRISLRARSSDDVAKALRVGDWVNVQLSWLPDPTSGVRGCDRIMQVIARRPPHEDGWIYLKLIDGGPRVDEVTDNLTVSPDPEFDSDGVPTVTVTDVPEGYVGRIDMALGATEPDADSPLWQPIAVNLEDAADYQSPFPVPVDTNVWVRWRIEKAGEQQGPWSDAVQVGAGGTETNTTPGLIAAAVSIDFESGDVTVTWRPTSVTGGVRVYYDIHDDETAADLVTDYVDADAADLALVLPDPVELGESAQVASVRIVPYPAFAISGTPGTAVVRRDRYPGRAELPTTNQELDDALEDYEIINLTDPDGIGVFSHRGTGDDRNKQYLRKLRDGFGISLSVTDDDPESMDYDPSIVVALSGADSSGTQWSTSAPSGSATDNAIWIQYIALADGLRRIVAVYYYSDADSTWYPTHPMSAFTLHSSPASVGSPADNAENTLKSYTLPGNTLYTDGQKIRIEASGTLAATTRSRTITVYFGASGSVIFSSSSSSVVHWAVTITITRVGSSSQRWMSRASMGIAGSNEDAVYRTRNFTTSRDLTADEEIKVTATVGGSAVASDIVCNDFTVEMIP